MSAGSAPGFDEVFSRLRQFYLSWAEAGFRSGYVDVCQLTMVRS